MNQGCSWDENTIDRLFDPFIAKEIKNTPIGEMGSRDKTRWRYDERGAFSVKSAYLLEIGFYAPNLHRSEQACKMWSYLVWNMSNPPKVRVFLWRAFSNFIPTSANLQAHHVPTEGICTLCGDRWGSTEHSLLHCPKISAIWKTSRFGAVVRKTNGLLLMEVAWAIFKEFGMEDYTLWAILLWQTWAFVCRLLHPDGEMLLSVTEERGVVMVETYQKALSTTLMAKRLGMEVGDTKWRKPARVLYRVDVDALFNREANAFGVGVVVRDAAGELVAATSKKMAPSSSVMVAEVMAVIHGIVFCLEQKIEPIEIFTDSFLAARVMANPEEEADLLPEDLAEILTIARANMLLGVSHMYRSANKVAHSLAQLALSSLQSICWTANFPSWLTS